MYRICDTLLFCWDVRHQLQCLLVTDHFATVLRWHHRLLMVCMTSMLANRMHRWSSDLLNVDAAKDYATWMSLVSWYRLVILTVTGPSRTLSVHVGQNPGVVFVLPDVWWPWAVSWHEKGVWLHSDHEVGLMVWVWVWVAHSLVRVPLLKQCLNQTHPWQNTHVS